MRLIPYPENEIPAPKLDYRLSFEDLMKRENDHKLSLALWLRKAGYDGPRTGEVVRFQVADGYAQYMMADNGQGSALMHLPYGDAYQYRDVRFLPRKEILRRLDQEKRFQALFDRKEKSL